MLLKIHRFLALYLGLFILTHLGAHLAALAGPEAHERALDFLRTGYRNRFLEPVLYLAIAAQIFAGARLAARRWRESDKGLWGWAQILSGAYLGVFFIAHASSALIARHVMQVETNFYWPGGSLVTEPLGFIFAPYYFLAALAVFTHLGAALHFRLGRGGARGAAPAALAVLGAGYGILVVLVFSGAFFPFELPPEHVRYFDYYTGANRP